MSYTVSWLDHEFTVYQPNDDWREVGGVYIFAGLKKDDQGKSVWWPFYIGQCQSFAGYISTHRKRSEAEQLGATHVHVHTMQGVLARQNFEAELIRQYRPPLNVQLKW